MKHFFKTLFIFLIMIALGLFGVFWVSSIEGNNIQNAETAPEVAE